MPSRPFRRISAAYSRLSTAARVLLVLGVAFSAAVVLQRVASRKVSTGQTTVAYQVTLSEWVLLVSAIGIAAAVNEIRRSVRAGRERAAFVTRVSHELRTPLTQITLLADTLRLGRANAVERGRHLDTIAREARRLSLLVDDVLRFAAAEHDAVRLAPEPTEVRAFVDALVGELQPVLRDVRLASGGADDAWIEVDRDALRQILLNVIDNAAKASPPGGVVRVGVEASDAQVVVSIDDEGPGVPVDRRRVVFEPFEGSARGTGIGLAIVRDLVDRHEGTVSIADAPSGGARIVVAFVRLASS